MDPSTRKTRQSSWLMPLTIACALLGLMGTWAYKNEVINRETGGGRATPLATSILKTARQQDDEYREEIIALRGKLAELEQAAAERSKLAKVMSDEMQSVRVFAGFVDVEGPGVTILLRDSPNVPAIVSPEIAERYLIHDIDIVRVVNELRAAGAEVLAVDGHRLTSRSAIRCVGPVIHVDGVPVSSPFTIQAIGDPETLKSAVNMPGGVLSGMRALDEEMVEVIVEEKLRIPAYSGSSKILYARPAEPVKP